MFKISYTRYTFTKWTHYMNMPCRTDSNTHCVVITDMIWDDTAHACLTWTHLGAPDAPTVGRSTAP